MAHAVSVGSSCYKTRKLSSEAEHGNFARMRAVFQKEPVVSFLVSVIATCRVSYHLLTGEVMDYSANYIICNMLKPYKGDNIRRFWYQRSTIAFISL